MKKTIFKTNHRISNHFRKTLFILLMLGIYSTGHAMLGLGGSGGPFVGNGDEKVDINPDWRSILTSIHVSPPCNVSNNCNEEDKYMPVWRWNATTRQMDACPSPLFIRKDEYTCHSIVRVNNRSPFNEPDPNAPPVPCTNCNIGYVGINNVEPLEQLHVLGNVRCDEGMFMGDFKVKNIYGVQAPDIVAFGTQDVIEVHAPMNFNNGFTAGNATISNLSVSSLSAGSLSVSSLTNNGDLFVNGVLRVRNASGQNVFRVDQTGQIRARRTTVDLQPIPDYVFKKGYKLMPIEDLESFVTKYNHLPKIKSEAEYQNAGEIDLGELNLKLLEKVEELTLHLIAQNKKIEALETKMNKLGK